MIITKLGSNYLTIRCSIYLTINFSSQRIDMKTEEFSKEEKIINIPLFSIIPDKNQPRKNFDKGALNELTKSIASNGVIVPIIVKEIADSKYMIIAGERRWRASIMAEQATIPAIVRDGNEFTNSMQSLLENLQRDDLNPIEEAHAYANLIEDHNLLHEELSDYVGKSRSNISNSLRLLKLPIEVQDYLISGDISYGHAKVILGLEKAVDMIYTALEVVGNKLSVRDTEKFVKNLRTTVTKPDPNLGNTTKQQLATQLTKIEENLTRRFSSKVSVKWRDNKGNISIDFHSLEDFERILDLLDE